MPLAAYRLRRPIGVDGAYSRAIVAVLGITAGPLSATAELSLLLLDLVIDLERSWPYVKITLYVDDLTLEATHRRRAAVTHMLAAAPDQVVDHFHRKLSLEVTAKKSVAVACRPSIAAGIVQLSRARKLTARRCTKLLGVASAGGRRRATGALKARLKTLTQRTPRIQALHRIGFSATRLAKSAGTPVAT